MLVCGCGRWMHTEGVDERISADGMDTWLVRSECRGCGLRVSAEGSPDRALDLVDRLTWTDDARHILERMPAYAAPLFRSEVDEYARTRNLRVVTLAVLARARLGDVVAWDVEAERRLDNVPAPVRSMAKIELERTAVEKGLSRVTVGLMEEVKARYFGLAAAKRDGS